MPWRALCLASCLALLPGRAAAVCPADGVSGAITVRLDHTAVPVLEGMLQSELPGEYEIPAEPTLLADCPSLFDDTVVTPHDGALRLGVRRASVSLRDGAIELDAELDIHAEAELELQLCAMPDASCAATLSAQHVSVFARATPRVDACELVTNLTALTIEVAPYATEVQLGGCGLYDEIGTLVYDWFRESLIDYAVEAIDAWVRTEVPALIETFSSDIFASGMELYGLRFVSAPESLRLAADGITATLTATLEPIDGPADCLPPGSTLPPEEKEAPAALMSVAHLSVAASEPFVQRALRAAWLAGWMCWDTRDYDLGLGDYLTDLVPDATLDALVTVSEPPNVRLGGVTDARPIVVEVTALNAQLAIGAPQLATSFVEINTGADFAGQLGMDAALQALVMGLTHVGTEGMSITAPGAELIFSPTALADLLDNLILPTFSDYLTKLPLTSSLFVYAPVATRLVEVGVQQGTHLRADLELVPIDRHDHTPPVTVLAEAPGDPSPPLVSITVASVDDTAPADFVRHRVELDGVALPELFSGTTLVLEDLAAGHHQLRVAAVDLNDNVDPTPVDLALFVDAAPPVVTVLEAPAGLLSVDEAAIRFAATDDVTATSRLALRYQAAIVQRVGDDLPLRQGELRPGQLLELTDLPEDAIIRVTLVAVDEAGNIGEAEVTFAINAVPTFSCSAAPSLVPAAALLLLLRRRRR